LPRDTEELDGHLLMKDDGDVVHVMAFDQVIVRVALHL
jgi:hypothetical protein